MPYDTIAHLSHPAKAIDTVNKTNEIIVRGVVYDKLDVNIAQIDSGWLLADLDLGHYFLLSMTENVTDFSFSNLPGEGNGYTVVIEITQGVFPYTFSLPSSVKWEFGESKPISTTSGSKNILALTTFDNGSTWHATLKVDV